MTNRDSRYPANFSASNPVPIARLWDADRTVRGGGLSGTMARCTVKACPVRFTAGDDRLCRDHDDDDADAARRVQREYGVNLVSLSPMEAEVEAG